MRHHDDRTVGPLLHRLMCCKYCKMKKQQIQWLLVLDIHVGVQGFLHIEAYFPVQILSEIAPIVFILTTKMCVLYIALSHKRVCEPTNLVVWKR